LIGFYIERKTASDAANKAFIVNRVGDFGMIIGLMAIFAGMETFNFGDVNGKTGIFSQVRPAEEVTRLTAGRLSETDGEGQSATVEHLPRVPDGMVLEAASSNTNALLQILNWREVDLMPKSTGERDLIRSSVRALSPEHKAALKAAIIDEWRHQGYGYWLLVVAGLGIFCGCVGKSAQFPLHVWLPDAMEGPTPVSALIHAATMVAAGVYLVGRCYPIFTPEVLLVIAIVGTITLFIAATIAITATDIKRVLAYSTVSQLGYMMLALGLGGWLAGMFHLFTHAFFKALLFLCSGSVIHATGTNEMPQMGGLRKKMPWTAGTMLVGCLAIAGAGIPTLAIGLSGYYSKDAILAQALSFKIANPVHGYFFVFAVLGAAITSFYMFRLWYMTFAGQPRDEHVYHHAHESPWVMVGPLVVLAFFAVVAGGTLTHLGNLGFVPLLEQARPAGTEEGMSAGWTAPIANFRAEHESHAAEIHGPAELWAFGSALAGFLLATVFYGLRKLDPDDVRRQFSAIYRFLVHKWWFDELYGTLFVRPTLRVSGWIAACDKRGIDGLVDGMARAVALVSRIDAWIDRTFVDGLVNGIAHATYAAGLRLRAVQSGNLRQYVMWLAVGTVALFLIISFLWNWSLAGPY
jgi:NADH-quinone oxidoreductase subunit L